MYFRTKCAYCSSENWHDIHVVFKRGGWEDIYLNDTVSEDELILQVIRGIQGYIKDGIDVKELYRILVDVYDIAQNFCCDLIQRIKLELGLYCPDRKHLYYVV